MESYKAMNLVQYFQPRHITPAAACWQFDRAFRGRYLEKFLVRNTHCPVYIRKVIIVNNPKFCSDDFTYREPNLPSVCLTQVKAIPYKG